MSILLNCYAAVRPLLFSMDAERAHEFTLKGLGTVHQSKLGKQLIPKAPVAKPISLMGLSCRNPVGLAAGLDKNGAYIDALGSFGFGFLEVGTVTPLPQPGNPKPRLFRIPQRQALVNRFGFNNNGLSSFLNNVNNNVWRKNGGILGLNIGKNALTPIESAVDDYLLGLVGVYEHADYITINISSPNTQNLRELQDKEQLGGLLATLNEKRKQLSDQHHRYVPIAVKIAPDLGHEQVKIIADVLIQNDIDGVIATNTTLSRASVEGMTHAHEQGGLSGPPVHALSLEVIRGLRKQLGSSFPIIGVGGINTAQDAIEKIEAGANAVQLYTGLIYQGPKLIHDCIKALDLL